MKRKSQGSFKEQFDDGTVFWHPCNVYPTADIGEMVSIGVFCEIGSEVVIGDGTRVGAHSFIPEGFSVGKNVFIGPGFVGTNDRYPMSPKERWEKTVICDGAKIGAGCTLLPGITIGEKARIGAGSIVTCNVPPGELWAGNPATRIADANGNRPYRGR